MNTFEETQQIKVTYACDGMRGQCSLDFSSSIFIGAWNVIIVNFNAAKPFASPASNNTAMLEKNPLAKKNPICLSLCLFLHWKETSLFILSIDHFCINRYD
jgi:hypothetical protein